MLLHGSQRQLWLPRHYLRALREAGVDIDRLARCVDSPTAASGLTPEQSDMLLDQALKQVRDPMFGLLAGTYLRPEFFGVVGMATIASPTLSVAYTRMARFVPLCCTDRWEVVQTPDIMALRVHLAQPDMEHARQRVNAQLSTALSLSRLVTQNPILPLRVSLRGPAPAQFQRYSHFFGCPVEFNAEVDELVFSAQEGARPLDTRNDLVSDALEARADQLLGEFVSTDVVQQVSAVVRRMLGGALPTIEALAKALRMSPRTLQRALAEANTSYSALLDRVRHQAARQALAQSDIDIAELSFQLGFANPASFFRAFKRWEGTTPLGYRRAARCGMSTPDGPSLQGA